MNDDDGGLQYFQQLGLQEQFDSIFNDEKGEVNERNANTQKTVSSKRNIMEGWSDERKKEWGQA